MTCPCCPFSSEHLVLHLNWGSLLLEYLHCQLAPASGPCDEILYTTVLYGCQRTPILPSNEALHHDRDVVHPPLVHLHGKVPRHHLQILPADRIPQQCQREVALPLAPCADLPPDDARPVVHRFLCHLDGFCAPAIEKPIRREDKKRFEAAVGLSRPPDTAVIDVGGAGDVRRSLQCGQISCEVLAPQVGRVDVREDFFGVYARDFEPAVTDCCKIKMSESRVAFV